MKTYLFTVPIAPGKTQTWKKYVKEMTGPKYDEYRKSRTKAGLKGELVYLQETPMGDVCVASLTAENPQKSFEYFLTSNEPFDKWFREKILIEAHGLDLSKPMPQNEQILDYSETGTREYTKSR